jgi:predicted dehydrogenase
MEKPFGVAIVGCGNIADPYARDLTTYPELKLLGVTDLDLARAEALAERYSTAVYSSLNAVLDDPAVDAVLNLTIHHAHYEVNRRCLLAGKHVHTEKPLSIAYSQARELVELAKHQGVRLSSSPFVLLGEAQQTAWKWVRENRLGAVRMAYAEVNWGRIETWHPAPQAFYEVGALYDVGVYPLTLLTGMFGPARRVSAYGAMLLPERITKEGVPYHLDTPDFMVTMVEFASGTLARLTTNFYVSQKGKQSGLELHGDAGSLYLESWFMPNSRLEYAPFNEPYEDVALVKEAPDGMRWGRAVHEMALAIQENRPHRASGEQAAHLVEILNAAQESSQTGQAVELTSTFVQPAPMDWAGG